MKEGEKLLESIRRRLTLPQCLVTSTQKDDILVDFETLWLKPESILIHLFSSSRGREILFCEVVEDIYILF